MNSIAFVTMTIPVDLPGEPSSDRDLEKSLALQEFFNHPAISSRSADDLRHYVNRIELGIALEVNDLIDHLTEVEFSEDGRTPFDGLDNY
jgi:hypothetical protein